MLFLCLVMVLSLVMLVMICSHVNGQCCQQASHCLLSTVVFVIGLAKHWVMPAAEKVTIGRVVYYRI